MRLIAALVLLTTLAVSQEMPSGKPEDLARLQADEVARMYRRGGLTRRGPFWSLIVVKKNGKVFVKGVDGSFSTRLSQSKVNDLKVSIRKTPWREIIAQKRSGLPHSAADGTDIYVSYRQEKVIRAWSNAAYDYPGSIPVVEALQQIEVAAKGGTTLSH